MLNDRESCISFLLFSRNAFKNDPMHKSLIKEIFGFADMIPKIQKERETVEFLSDGNGWGL